MICKWCNQQNVENSKFCINCGKELSINNNPQNTQFNNLNNNNFANNTNDNSYYNNLNQNNYQPQNTIIKEEKANIGLAILSWIIPLAGLIIYIVKKDTEPKTAKVCGICALISTILPFLLLILIAILGMLLSSNWENINHSINDLWAEESTTNNYYD